MTNEARKITLYGENGNGDAADFICASDASLAQGTLLVLSADRTVAAQSTTGEVFIGVAAMEKVNDDYSTSISAYQNGEFTMVASGSITRGDQLITAAGTGNNVMSSNAITTNPMGKLVGIALNSASAGEDVAVRINK